VKYIDAFATKTFTRRCLRSAETDAKVAAACYDATAFLTLCYGGFSRKSPVTWPLRKPPSPPRAVMKQRRSPQADHPSKEMLAA
jgi:hypothetical protein